MKKCKIVMIAMFKNEASVIRRMLDSCLPYVDYYVLQNNGSTDGTEQIVMDFLEEHDKEGVIYNCSEGWVGFGWNRDHLIRYCQQINHGCDWILKMDCDEQLEIDDDFDWSLLDDHTIDSFHITAVAGTCIYYRCWMWNANLKWAFNHDPCHETIYCLDPNIGDHFQRYNLPTSFKQIGFNEGQSWLVPTKFVSDALILEEKMIREQTMMDTSGRYHFWYIGKSYFDAHVCHTFPLGEQHAREYARRAIWYFNQWINDVYKGKDPQDDEMAYNGLILSAEARIFLQEDEEAITTYKQAGLFAQYRNDHLIGLARIYQRLQRWEEMFEVASKLLEEDRVNPFPRYASFINNEHYYDTGQVPQQLYDDALAHVLKLRNEAKLPFFINKNDASHKRLFVVDNFYSNPDQVREFALNVEYGADIRWYKGLRSLQTYKPEGIKGVFENIIGEKIIDFDSGFNGVFQLMYSNDPQVYHYDTQKWAAMIYLTPNAPLQSGTRLHRSIRNGANHITSPNVDQAFNGDFYDSTLFDIQDNAGNVYNRLVIMNAQCIHSAGPYFGNTPETGRLTHLYFFD